MGTMMKTFLKNYWGDIIALAIAIFLTYRIFGDVIKELVT